MAVSNPAGCLEFPPVPNFHGSHPSLRSHPTCHRNSCSSRALKIQLWRGTVCQASCSWGAQAAHALHTWLLPIDSVAVGEETTPETFLTFPHMPLKSMKPVLNHQHHDINLGWSQTCESLLLWSSLTSCFVFMTAHYFTICCYFSRIKCSTKQINTKPSKM